MTIKNIKLSDSINSRMSDEIKNNNYEYMKGWFKLINNLDLDISKIAPDYIICDIKEKYGGLRFYTYKTNQQANDLINKAEEQSFFICQECSNPGRVVIISHYSTTLCKNCHKKYYV